MTAQVLNGNTVWDFLDRDWPRSPHAEYVGPVGPAAQDPATVAQFATRLEQLADDEGDIVELTDIPATCAWAKSLSLGPRWHCEPTPCANVPLPVDYTAMSRSTRKEHRRRTRDWDNLTASGRHVAYRRTTTVTELTTTYVELLDLHGLRRPDEYQAHTEKTWTAVLQNTGSHTAVIATLELDAITVAAQLCLHRGQRCYFLRPAIHPAHAQLDLTRHARSPVHTRTGLRTYRSTALTALPGATAHRPPSPIP
jgi:hypothetical protein